LTGAAEADFAWFLEVFGSPVNRDVMRCVVDSL
jgi:hypothetical protein